MDVRLLTHLDAGYSLRSASNGSTCAGLCAGSQPRVLSEILTRQQGENIVCHALKLN